MNLDFLKIDELEPRDKTERKIVEHIGILTLRLIRHRQKTQGLVPSEQILEKDKEIIGRNVMGERLLNLRKDRGLTQEELERKSTLSQSKISRIEAGTKIMSIEDAKLLAPALKVSAKFLISGRE